MKNQFLASKTGLLLITGFICLPITIFIILFTLKQDLTYLTIILIPVFTSLILICFRKIFFSKIIINEYGIQKTYRKHVINSLSWDDLKIVKAIDSYNLFFLKEDYNRKQLSNMYKTVISFNISHKSIQILLLYKKNFQQKITDISVLSKHYQYLLSN